MTNTTNNRPDTRAMGESAEPVKRDLPAIDKAIKDYLEDYELRADEGSHTPTDGERFLIYDAISGLLSEPEFVALLAAPGAAQPVITALRDLEAACDALCSMRTQEQYLSMIDGGQQDALSALDDARRAARAALSGATVSAQATQAEQTDFAAWLAQEMPAGTIIGDPAWWAPRILRAAQAPAVPLLAAEHKGMRVDYSGMLMQAANALVRGHKESGLAEMLRQFQGHMTELGLRWYAGDTAVVDELLQLYCVAKDSREACKTAASTPPASAAPAAPQQSEPSASPAVLTEGQREAILEVMDLARDEGLPGTAETLQSILAASPAPYPAQPFAVVIDRTYDGEGPTLAVWNGENYSFSDGDCFERETDGTLDGFAAEWLTHHQLEQRLHAAAPEMAGTVRVGMLGAAIPTPIEQEKCWRTIVEDLVEELEEQVCHRYQGYPPDDRRFVRDMLTVKEAREFLEAHKEKL